MQKHNPSLDAQIQSLVSTEMLCLQQADHWRQKLQSSSSGSLPSHLNLLADHKANICNYISARMNTIHTAVWDLFPDERYDRIYLYHADSLDDLATTTQIGRRTAWTCIVTVGSMLFEGRYFYDGHANAKDDAAEVTFKYLHARTNQ